MTSRDKSSVVTITMRNGSRHTMTRADAIRDGHIKDFEDVQDLAALIDRAEAERAPAALLVDDMPAWLEYQALMTIRQLRELQPDHWLAVAVNAAAIKRADAEES